MKHPPQIGAAFAGADLAESTGVEEAASFVVDLLHRPASDIRVVEGQLDLLEDLVVDGHPDSFELSPLSPVDTGTVWAVDGGSTLLADGRSFQVAAYRASRVRFRAGVTDLVQTPPLTVRAISAAEVQGIAREILTELCGAEPERIPELPRPVDALREWAEWAEVHRTIADAEAGDLLLVDGSLHGGPLVPPQVVRRAHEEAVAKGVALAGVVKASTLFWGRNAPLVTLLKRRGDRELGTVPWAARISTDPVFGRLYVGEIFVAHLAGTAAYAFRVDVARGPTPVEEVLARLCGAADDPAFVGYPYPLARAHQAARVTGYAVADLRRTFRDALSRQGMSEDDIEVLFQDFHDILNRS
ncbi:MAG TPA: DNA double-strand break repair nuclease NurA [Actinomycetota bacterium]|nr:DNA double-strand break repair nuclease NurA [Actinomycetota bacterium]